jgi:hypothetical protein
VSTDVVLDRTGALAGGVRRAWALRLPSAVRAALRDGGRVTFALKLTAENAAGARTYRNTKRLKPAGR